MTSAPPAVDPANIAFLTDFDGTLIPYGGSSLQHVARNPVLPRLLAKLIDRTGGATAVVTGRGVAELDGLLEPLRLPVSGTHGAEFRATPDGPIELDHASGELDHLHQLCVAFVGNRPGVVIERKTLTLVLHFHDSPAFASPALDFAYGACREVAGFVPQAGRGVIEFKPIGADKGKGVQRVMARAPFAGRLPVFVGDDLPDEAGFAVVNDMGGISIRVGDGDSVAKYRLPNVEAVLAYIRTIAG